MPTRELTIGLEIIATRDDLIADYVPDSSGRYRLFRVDDYLVTSINDDDVFAQRLTRAPEYDGDEIGEVNRSEWMLTDRFGDCPDLGEEGVCWIDGEAYTLDWEDHAVAVGAPRASSLKEDR